MNSSCYLANLHQNSKGLVIVLTVLIIAVSSGLHCGSEPCMYGVCLDDLNSSYSCYCIDGYTGINCEINWDDCWSNPCLNGGTCNDAVAAYNCTCTEGFGGVNCEQRFSECSNTPCLNNGTCSDYNGFSCQCPEGYSGDYCEIDASVCNNSICKNFGECIEGPGFSFSCRCLDGWTGELCDEDIDECTTSPCQNGGLCINIPATYTCACLFGYTGKNCDKAIVPCDNNPCENDAICLLEDGQPVCYCVPDYHGILCELRYNECESKFAQCENGGTCIDGINNFTCSCAPHYAGETCTDFTPSPKPTSEEIPGYYSGASSMPTTIIFPFRSTDFSTARSTAKSGVTTERVDRTSISTPTINTTNSETRPSESTTSLGTISTVRATEGSTEFAIDNISSSRTTPESLYHSIETDQPYLLTKYTTDIGDTTFTTDASTTKQFSTSFVTSTELYRDISTTAESIPDNASRETSIFTYGPTISKTTSKDTVLVVTDEGLTPENTSTFSTGGITTTATSKGTIDLSSPVSTMITMREFPTKKPTISMTTSTNYVSNVTPVETSTPNIIELTNGTTINASFALITDSYTTESRPVDYGTSTEKHQVIYNCTQQPCVNATICKNNSVECNCSYSDNCKSSPDITDAAFNGKSFIRQHLSLDDDGKLQIFIRLKTRSKNGILVHLFFDEDRYILLYMEIGQLKFQFSCGLQTMLLGEIDSPINNGYNVDIEVRFRYMRVSDIDKCSATLLLNDTVAMSGEQVVSTQEDIPQEAKLHLGGIPLAFSHYFPHVAMGFVGCMSLLKVNDIQRHLIRDSADTFQIEECTSFLCLSNPCKNYGACQEVEGRVHCECIAGYTGDVCERSACDDNPCHLGATCISSPGTGFMCICPLGAHGLLCEEEITIVQPTFSVFVPGVSSYIAYGLAASIRDGMELKMRLMPNSLEQISLIAYMGQSSPHRDLSDHFSITYVRGYIMFTWDLGSGVRRIFTNSPLTTKAHRPHTLRIGRNGRDAWLSVDGLGNVTGRSAGTMTRLDVAPVLYIGGHKAKNFEVLPHDLPLHTGFSGCIFDVELRTGNTVYPVTKFSPATGRGVGECHRNECTHRSCKNGAVCLNHGPTYSCVCTKDWMGPDCSQPVATCPGSSPHCQKIRQRGS